MMYTDVMTASLLLALANLIEFFICVKAWWEDKTAKSWWGALTWLGSAFFWLFRGSMPV